MKKNILRSLVILILLFSLPAVAFAQNYSFSLDEMDVHAFWQEDGTLSLDYTLSFTNSPSADALDFVDVGLPNTTFNLSNVRADMNGIPLTQIENSPYVTGVAVGLGEQKIAPGDKGTVHVVIDGIKQVLYPDDKDKAYVSAVFKTTWFDQKFVSGSTKTQVTFHLPPGVTPEEPRWHSAPSGFPSEPVSGFDEQGRIIYTWKNPQATASEGYTFGASFPVKYLPASAVVRPDPLEPLFSLIGGCVSMTPCLLVVIVFVVGIFLSARAARRRSMQYLPPAISIEGHGIKRGLTAVEAAVLMEQPMEKILTMILFSTLKKNAAEVLSREPLKIKVNAQLPEGLYPYEEDFLKVFSETNDKKQQRTDTREMIVNLVKSLAVKMKGFSRKETVAYYKDILEKAWQQVESAQTPDMKSTKYDEVMDWTMLDKNFDGRTKEVFRSEPIFLPTWWLRYDPSFSRGGSTFHDASPISSMPSIPQSMPTLPGGEFAASMVTGMQNFAGGVVGNITDFTNSITNATNPPPKTSSSSSRSGGGCACACACAGCACACAGGGR